MVLEGTDLGSLQAAIDQLPPGPIEVIIGLPREINYHELNLIEKELRKRIDLIEVQYGSTPEWNNALKVVFSKHNPIPTFLIIPMIYALGIVGIGGILGWRIGEVIREIGRHILPISLVAIGAWVFVEVMKIRKK